MGVIFILAFYEVKGSFVVYLLMLIFSMGLQKYIHGFINQFYEIFDINFVLVWVSVAGAVAYFHN